MPFQVCHLLDPKNNKQNNDQMQEISRKVFITDKISKAQLLGSRIGFDPRTAQIMLDQQPCEIYKQALDFRPTHEK